MQQIQIPPLAEGEVYLCGIIDANGTVMHTILLPGDTKATWGKALEWAKSVGGDLPTRAEQAIAYAKLRDQFEQTAYWSNEVHADNSAFVWYQTFDLGGQTITHKNSHLRARAVRRLII